MSRSPKVVLESLLPAEWIRKLEAEAQALLWLRDVSLLVRHFPPLTDVGSSFPQSRRILGIVCWSETRSERVNVFTRCLSNFLVVRNQFRSRFWSRFRKRCQSKFWNKFGRRFGRFVWRMFRAKQFFRGADMLVVLTWSWCKAWC